MTSTDDEHRSALADVAGRAAFFPARAAARAWRGQLEEAADEVLSAPEIARLLDRALAGSLPEEFARSVVRHRVLERIVASGGTCFGDSGGPDLLGGTDTVLAVNSYVTNVNCSGVIYSQRVDVPEVLEWIESYL